MSLTPFAVLSGPKVADFFCSLPFGGRFKAGCETETLPGAPPMEDHLIIVGYGLNGRILAKAAQVGEIPHIVIDMNPETVMREREKGENIFFGDATNPTILTHANIGQARILVIVINDPVSTRAITRLARQMNPGLFILVRTRFLTDVTLLRNMGADEVISEDFETSMEIFTRVLKKYLVPEAIIDCYIKEVRAGTYDMLRSPSAFSANFSDLKVNLPDLAMCTLLVEQGSTVCGRTLADLDIRRRYAVSVLAVKRQQQVIENPSGEMDLQPGDEVIVMGAPDKIKNIEGLFRTIKEAGDSENAGVLHD